MYVISCSYITFIHLHNRLIFCMTNNIDYVFLYTTVTYCFMKNVLKIYCSVSVYVAAYIASNQVGYRSTSHNIYTSIYVCIQNTSYNVRATCGKAASMCQNNAIIKIVCPTFLFSVIISIFLRIFYKRFCHVVMCLLFILYSQIGLEHNLLMDTIIDIYYIVKPCDI